MKRRDLVKKARDLENLETDEEKLQYIRQNTGLRTAQYKNFRQQLQLKEMSKSRFVRPNGGSMLGVRPLEDDENSDIISQNSLVRAEMKAE